MSSSSAEATKNELIRFVLEQLKAQRLAKAQALGFLQYLDQAPKAEKPAIAITGIACRFPGADNKEAFWQDLARGVCRIRPFPESRVRDLALLGEQTGLFDGGFLDRVDTFDAAYFGIPPRAARHLDPYHRLMLETLVEAIEDAGYQRGELHGQSVGIFVGNDHTHRYINSYLNFVDELDFGSITGSWTGVLASRLSYLLNLTGPAVVVDTACSSGLVALDAAIKAIHDGDCGSALVAAANLFFAPRKGMVGDIENADFRVRAFDEGASGTAWGEGVAALLVKPLARAIADGDPVYGVIRSIAVNNDGTSSGLTAPNARAQKDVLLQAWERAGIHPQDLGYIEAHGTGTHLGDPIEIKGLLGAFSEHTEKRQFCAIGSVKTNIGHTVAVAGLASLIKVLLAFKHEQLPPSLNFQVPNGFIDFCRSPVYVNDRLSAWPRGTQKRLAGVSSFSLSGTNCHVVLEEPPATAPETAPARPEILPVSARTPALLRKTVGRLKDYWASEGKTASLADLAFTASVGREHHAHRLAFVVEDRLQLETQLAQVWASLEAEAPWPETVARTPKSGGEIDRGRRDQTARDLVQALAVGPSDAITRRARLDRLGQLYVEGAPLKWTHLYAGEKRRRLALPAQPFLRERYWDKTVAAPAVAHTSTDANVASSHPLDLSAADFVALVQRGPSRLSPSDPANLTHRILAYVWSEVLGYPQLNLTDDFYALGGDSISGVRIIHILNRVFGLEAEIGDLLSASTLSAFADALVAKHRFNLRIADETTASDRPNEFALVEPASFYPLSRAQTRMYLLASVSPGSTVYNVNAVFETNEPLDVPQLETVVRQIIARHEILRTAFALRDGRPVQIVHPIAPFTIETWELPATENLAAEHDAVRRLATAFIRPFDLSQPGQFRLGVLRRPGQPRSYLVIDLHHIITDGSSMGVLLQEIRGLSSDRAASERTPLPPLPPLQPLPFQYKEFAAWEARRAQTDAYAAHRAYWQQQYSGELPVLELSTDFPRPALQDFKGARHHFLFPRALTARLHELAQRHSATLFMVLSAAFRVLLYKWEAGCDTVLGTPVTGRPRHELHRLIGMFVNTLALREQLREEESFAQFLRRVKANTLEALAHQEYSYEELVGQLGLPRDPSRNALFDVYLVLQNEDMGLGYDGGVRTLPFDSGTAKFDQTVICRETAEGLQIEWEYATSLFRASTIARFGDQFQRLLEAVCAAPGQPLHAFEILSPEERSQLLFERNATLTPYPRESSLGALFQAWARRQPEAVALIKDGRNTTYSQLEAASNRLAHFLIGRGYRSEPIALLYDRTEYMMVAILAVLKAGCAYLPLDPENPEERSRGILEDSAARLLLVGAECQAAPGWTILSLCPEHLDLADLPETSPDLRISASDTAYIIYTSGTTGRPKGTLIPHRAVSRVVCQTNFIQLTERDTCLALASYAFDGSILDLYGALLNGGRLVLPSKAEALDLPRLGRLIRETGVTSFFATTSLFNLLLDHQIEDLRGVRLLLFGGEAASFRHVERGLQLLGPGRLINGYGPTETTVFATTFTVDRLDPRQGFVPIGRPIANTAVYVLDKRMRPVPTGVVGELYIAGDGLASGYLNRPELTRERFLSNPFWRGPGDPNDRLYRTGDRVKWLEDGNLQFLGRIDHQVKIRGFRVELEEIEIAIQRQPGIKECLVVAHPHASGQKQLCAYVVPTALDAFSPEHTMAALRLELPDYMIPSAIMPLPAFELNQNGKIDRRKLPAPEIVVRDAVASRNEQETQLIGLWSELLGLKSLGIEDNFFALGGDSIKAIQIVARLQSLGFETNIGELFTHPTIAGFSAQLRKTSAPTAAQGPVVGPLPLNPIQRWFFERRARAVFNQSIAIEQSTLPRTDLLATACRHLCAHHDALRARFLFDGTAWQGEIGADPEAAYRLLEYAWDESALTSPTSVELLRQAQRGLDLSEGPLLNLALLCGEHRHVLVFAVHHLVVDLISWSPLLEDFQTCLSAAEAGKIPLLPRKTLSFSAWNQALVAHAAGAEVREQLPYWRGMAGRDAIAICPREQPAGLVENARTAVLTVDSTRSAQLQHEAHRAYRTEPPHLLLCALKRALNQWRGQGDFWINLEAHGRDALPGSSDAGCTVGWFTVAYPVLLCASNRFNDLGADLKATKEALRSAHARGPSYALLRYLTELPKDDETALAQLQPQIGFNYLGRVDTGEPAGDSTITFLPRELTTDPQAAQELALDFVISVKNDRLVIEALYDTARLSAEEVDALLLLLDDQLHALLQHCLAVEGSEATASDFAAAELRPDELESIFEDLNLH